MANTLTPPAAPEGKSPPPAANHKDLQLALLAELGAAMRARSEAEHLYTAAAVGGFGAVAWGVAALQPDKYLSRPAFQRPAVVAAFGVLIVTASVASKIWREHNVYAEAKKEQARIVSLLASLPGAAELFLSTWAGKTPAAASPGR